MKLVLCLQCDDVFKLARTVRTCECGECGGRYFANGVDAEYWGETAIPLGFANSTLMRAVNNQPHSGLGEEFTAFVVTVHCPTMKKVERP